MLKFQKFIGENMTNKQNIFQALYVNFLGNSPQWYKTFIIACLVINPMAFAISPYIAGWLLVIEFIFTLAMALKCYPLQPGGLLAIEAIFIGMTNAHNVKHEIVANIDVILLLVFMVAGIYFMKDLLMFAFTKLITKIKSKIAISLAFVFAAAFLSAFLDALTVIAVVISVGIGFYSVYHRVASNKAMHDTSHSHTNDNEVDELNRQDLEEFRWFLASIIMHAGVGTALGGVMTMVGEPQNLIIAAKAGWGFSEFALRMASVTIPVFAFGLITTVLLEKFKLFGYGHLLSDKVRGVLIDFEKHESDNRTTADNLKLFIQALVAIWLIIALAFHLAAVGLIGLSVIILITSFCGVIDEHKIGQSFTEALPFTALLCVFFTIVAVIIDQQLFIPIIEWVLEFSGKLQLVMFFIANGLLSMISDNVFVGSVYITEVYNAFAKGEISRDDFDLLAVAINTGTNLPSVATPNGQAAFLFLLTSALAPLIRLSYGKMVIMALPYTIVLTTVGLGATYFLLPEATNYLYDMDMIHHHVHTLIENNTSSH